MIDKSLHHHTHTCVRASCVPAVIVIGFCFRSHPWRAVPCRALPCPALPCRLVQTELPSFVSDKFLVMFDPHAKYLPDTNPNNPGKMIDFTKHAELPRVYPSVFAPLKVFGCSFEKPYKGTIFRFPLRTPAQAKESKLTSSNYSADGVEAMLRDFQEEAHAALLFLKHVEHIVVFLWDGNNNSGSTSEKSSSKGPRRCFRASITNLTDALRRRRALQWDGGEADAGAAGDGVRCDFKMEILSEYTAAPAAAAPALSSTTAAAAVAPTASSSSAVTSTGITRQIVRTFAVFNQFGGRRTAEFLSQHEAAGLGLIPWGGCAALLSTTTNHTGGAAAAATAVVAAPSPCTASCTLPLPIVTGLPVHVNGFFELSSNRRDVWYGGDLVGVGAVRCQWNELLLEAAVTTAYVRFAEHCRDLVNQHHQHQQQQQQQGGAKGDDRSPLDIYKFFPSAAAVKGAPWSVVVVEFYRRIVQQRLKLFYVRRHGTAAAAAPSSSSPKGTKAPPLQSSPSSSSSSSSVEWVDIASCVFACADDPMQVAVADILSGHAGGPLRAPVCVVPGDLLDTLKQQHFGSLGRNSNDGNNNNNNNNGKAGGGSGGGGTSAGDGGGDAIGGVLQVLSPAKAREMLRSVVSALHPRCLVLPRAHFETLSAYCLSDVTVASGISALVGVPILAVRHSTGEEPGDAGGSGGGGGGGGKSPMVVAVPLALLRRHAGGGSAQAAYASEWSKEQIAFAHALLAMGFDDWAFVAAMVTRFAVALRSVSEGVDNSVNESVSSDQ
jgi:hypothetical protein